MLMESNDRQIYERIKKCSNVNYDLMIKVQDWVLKHSNVVTSPITSDTLLVKNEKTGEIFVYFYI